MSHIPIDWLQNESILMFNREMTQSMPDPAILRLICLAREFDNIRVREEELPELDILKQRCHMECKAPVENAEGKINVLMQVRPSDYGRCLPVAVSDAPFSPLCAVLQAFISRLPISSFTLSSDTSYITQSAGRVSRALFEVLFVFVTLGWC